MRRLLTFAAFLLVLSLVPLCAQRGGHVSGGGHGRSIGSPGGFGGHSGFVGHGSGGPMHVSSGFNHYGAGSRSFARGERFHGERLHQRGFRHHCYGCYGYRTGYDYGYGYPFYSYYDPYWWYDSYSSYDEDAEREREVANEMNAENLDEQRMRQQNQDLYARLAYGRPRPQAGDPQPRGDDRAHVDPATVLVFRDQHQREIQNYAIVGSMLWNFTPQRTEKIPLSELDIPATTKANDDRGVDFKLPISSEG